MFESKYSKVLTVILVIVIIAIIGLLGFLAYDYYQNYMVTKDSTDFVDNFQGEVTDGEANENTTVADNNDTNPLDQIKDSNSNSTKKTKKTYKGFGVLGTMEIPKTNFKYPVLEKVTKTKGYKYSDEFILGILREYKETNCTILSLRIKYGMTKYLDNILKGKSKKHLQNLI